MNKAENFQVQAGLAVFRPSGEVTLGQGIELVTGAINEARQLGIRKMLVVTNGLTGFASPSVGTRYFFVHEWAKAAQGQVSVALVARPEMIDPQKFGVSVANSAGLTTDVFTSEDEAMAWLRRLA
jgi:hypothetical protein